MADVDELQFEEKGKNTMLHEAMEALRQGNRARARDLLTRLLKVDQKNSTYWVWLSAAVDTQKESVYCLQRAIEADPQDVAAKRGLILFGALPPDDSVRPFPINKTPPWREKLIALQEAENKRGEVKGGGRSRIMLGALIVIVGLMVGGYFLLSYQDTPLSVGTSTSRPTSTLTLTSSTTPVFRTPTPTFLGPTPLSFFLLKTYTPTALYVATQHPVLTRASFDAGVRSLALGNFDIARVQFNDVLKSEPSAVDAYYYLGESYRLEGDYRNAKDQYQKAINLDAAFAPAFLGRALAKHGLNANADVIKDLDEAINLDPTYAEAYITRGIYLEASDPSGAKSDLETAIKIYPYSAPAYLHLAEVQLVLGENEAALESAKHANDLDMTLVPVYLALGRAYIATGQTEQAISVLQTYVIYEPSDASAYMELGTAYNAMGNYEAAVGAFDKVISADRHNATAYFQRGMAYLNLNDPQKAETDFNVAIKYDAGNFDAQLNLARVYFMQDKPGDAYIQAEQKALPLAKTDENKAQCYYWEALFLEKIPDKTSAEAYWRRLLLLPEAAMPQEWRNTAYEHLNITPTFTPSLSPTKTATTSSTQTPTKTLKATSTLHLTSTPTATLLQMKTSSVTTTPTPK
jgi:tetratricopeptide (TPR) repeat protein